MHNDEGTVFLRSEMSLFPQFIGECHRGPRALRLSTCVPGDRPRDQLMEIDWVTLCVQIRNSAKTGTMIMHTALRLRPQAVIGLLH